MICFNCKTQIPDDASACPNCGAPVVSPVQVAQEIRLRRWQRWFFYAILAVVFLAMTAYAAKAYYDNANLLSRVTESQKNLDEARSALAQKETELTDKAGQISQLEQNLTESQRELNEKTEEFKRDLDAKSELLNNYNQFQVKLGSANAGVYDFLVKNGTGISANDLKKIPVAEFNLAGTDADGDGLSDVFEEAIGTDKTKADSDGDSYSDKTEILNGYNPLGTGKMPLDTKFASQNKGLILLAVEGNGEAWYVSPKDGKRYFLGRPAEALEAMQQLGKINQ